MSIQQLLNQAQLQNIVTIPNGWGQGRATFGGLIAGLLYSRLVAVLGDAGHDRVLRSATVSFIGAVTAGEIELRTEIFRSGKSVTQAEARLIQNGEVLAVLLASFGRGRESEINVPVQAVSPVYNEPDDCLVSPFVVGITPDFLTQMELRWSHGKMPFTGAKQPDFGGWMRWQDSFPEMTTAHLLALIDAWPPSVLPMYKTIAPISTLSWTVEFLAHPVDKTSENWWQYQVRTDASKAGYAHTEAHIWDDEGNLVAISRQTVTVFA